MDCAAQANATPMAARAAAQALRLRAGAAAVLLCAAACARAEVAQSVLDPAADQALAIDLIWKMMLWICTIMYALVIAGVVAIVVRRRRAQAQPGAPVSDTALARALGVWIVLIAVGLVALSATSFLVDRRLIPASDAALNVRITAHQWWWQIEYLDADPHRRFTTANELHLPRGRLAHLELRADDVIHSFWLPNLAGKRDMIPGRSNAIDITPRRSGTFRGPCAEFCGLQHAKMTLFAFVEDDAAFAAWRERQLQPAAQPSDERTRHGAQVFADHECALCHAIRGTAASAQVAPDLTHVAGRTTLAAGALPFDAESLAAWIAAPQQIKPGTKMPKAPLSGDELGALVGYLQSLR